MVVCPYCLSTNIIWDSFYGSVVCSSCGIVLAENLIDDGRSSFYADDEEGLVQKSLERQLRLKLKHRETRPDPLASPINKKALEVLKRNREVYEILVEVSKHPKIKSRKLRMRVALALYLYLRTLGYLKSKAIAEASRRAGVSARCLERVIKEREIMVVLEKLFFSETIKTLEG
ncbi:MAG: TFIIB-type zinc ribbon-containing protein, partial [Acidilobaceae archaeon]